jgi:hypothetical protein
VALLSRTLLVVVLVCGSVAAAAAQTTETRAGDLQRQREEKQKTVTTYEPTAIERAMDLAENKVVPLLQRDGLYAQLGNITTGSGFAYGAGWRDRSLVKGLGALNVWGAFSLKRYWALEGRFRYPLVEGGVLNLEGVGRIYDYPEEQFFGIGPDSRREDLSNYRLSGTSVIGRAAFRPWAHFTTGGHAEWAQPKAEPGRSRRFQSIDGRFDPPDLPGFLAEPNYLRSGGFAEVDYRQPLNARKGGWYRFDASRYHDRTTGTFSFNSFEADVRQFASILAERRVFAARALVTTTNADAGAEIPFYLLPTLGGNDTLRGFRSQRFRGPHRMLMQAEYRWEIWSAFEAALFVDAGKVAMRRADLNFKDLERDYGIGFRFNTDNGVVFRVDAAFGSRDGKHLHIVAGGIF